MAHATSFPLIAVDVGNHRVKLGDFERALAQPVPRPDRAVALPLDCSDDEFVAWLPAGRKPGDYTWAISSVNRPAAARVIESLERLGVAHPKVLVHADLPFRIELPRPEKVGMDRLANALAARALRAAHGPAVVVAVGTAITVDLVSAEGAFMGGAILAGLDISARALHEFTDLLPLVEVARPAACPGRSTIEAMQSGLYWGAIGAIRELIARLANGDSTTEVFLTGGGAPALVDDLGHEASWPLLFVPHLTLSGIALAMLGLESKNST